MRIGRTVKTLTMALWLAAAAGAASALAQPASPSAAQPAGPPDWPIAADIPRPTPAAIGLAGASEPDIVRFLAVRGIGEVQITPDGRHLLYTSNVTGEPQLWKVDATGGWPQQLTFGTGIAESYILPDGSAVLVGADTNGDERVGFTTLSLDGTRERTVLPRSEAYRSFGAFDDTGSRFAYASTERNGADFDIYIADVATGTSRMVFESRGGLFPVAWRPGRDQLVVARTRGEDSNDLHLLDLASRTLTPLFAPRQRARFDTVTWKPDGSGFYLITDQDRDFAALAFYDMASRRLTLVDTPQADVEAVKLTPDGRTLLWLTNEEGFSVLRARDLASGRLLDVPALPRGVYTLSMARAAPVVAIRVNGGRTPATAYVWDIARNALSLAAQPSTAGLDLAGMAQAQPMRFAARDGLQLHGLYYAPAPRADGAKPPLVVLVHGGPTSQARPTFSATRAYMVARGYAVFDLNFRGSTGFGKAFSRANDGEKQQLTVRDTADAVLYLTRAGLVDPERVAVMGGSYGGYIVNAALGEYPELFRAGVSLVGVADWVRALETASPELKASDREEYGDISDPKVRAFFASISPINTVGRIKAPVLVQHGRNDPRNPVQESDAFVTGVRNAGGTVTYLRFEDEGHGIRKVANRAYAYRRIVAFLNEAFGMQ